MRDEDEAQEFALLAANNGGFFRPGSSVAFASRIGFGICFYLGSLVTMGGNLTRGPIYVFSRRV